MVFQSFKRGPKKKNIKDGLDITSDAIEVLTITEPTKKKIPSKTWRECIKKVWEVDPLECPNCGGEMKIISFIDQPLLIRCILEHLNLWQERISSGLPPPAHLEDIVDAVVCEAFDDGWEHHNETDSTLY